MFRKGLAKKITTVITATSFSPYVIVYEAKASTEAPSTSKDDISTGDSMMVIYASFAMVFVLAGAVMSEITYVISEVIKCDFFFDEIKTIPGKIKYGKQYEEYHVDFEKLRQMVMDTFYEKLK
mgnify:CR=1 FL=1